MHGSNAVFTRLIQDSATVILIGNKFNHNIYKAKDLSNIFGNYGDGDDDELDNSPEQSSTSATVANPGIPKRIARRVGHRRIVVKKKRRVRRAS